ncbi:MAG: alkaline phosphatase family protein [Syntrophorhabdaceae bacterium]|nr:alkaline phosphatase family protein [Syntrophorhabdaceae bacterium]
MKLKDIRRTIVCMYDGFGIDYFEKSDIPTMKKMAAEGFFKKGKAVFPTLTNANNFSIICACWPETHGVTTNCYYDEKTNSMKFFEDHGFVMVPTIFRLLRERGIKSALLTCKEKTLKLVGDDVHIGIAAESPSQEIISRYGKPPSMYTDEVNYWLWDVAIDLLKTKPEIKLIYIHTTDYPMHKWSPEQPQSMKHMSNLDLKLLEAHATAHDAQFFITADHGMNPKTQCIDLLQTCKENDFEIKYCISPVADRLIEHHRGFGGVAYLYLKRSDEIERITQFLLSINGVDDVLNRKEASERFRLMPDRIGDLIVLGDKDTVFGETRTQRIHLPPDYRNHGSLYEQDVPIIAYGFDGNSPDEKDIQFNFELIRWLIGTIL